MRDDGQPVGVETVLLRELLLKFIAGAVTVIGWLIDGLWPLGERENRALHDFAASTHVVSTRARSCAATAAAAVAARRGSSRPASSATSTAAYAAANRIREAIQQRAAALRRGQPRGRFAARP